jgi:hypothetical protein
MDPSKTELKIIVAKLIELAYSKDKGLTAKIMAQKGNVRLTVDQNGNATLSGSAGILTFSGTTVLKTIGVKIKRVSVSFTNPNQDGMKVDYTATFDLVYIKLSVSGNFDIKELITSCSGLLCQAARSLENQRHNMELQEIMGH